MKFQKQIISIGLILGIVLIINLLSSDLSFRLDFTEDNQYTLSDASINILKNLDEPVTIKAYFSQDLPPKVAAVQRDFKDLLIEYANRSNGKVMYQIINPNENDDLEKEAMQNGIQPVLINVRDKDQMKQQKAYLGAVIKMGDRKEVIPFMQPGTPLEYSLSSTIKKVAIKNKPIVGIIQGQGEADAEQTRDVRAGLEVLHQIQDINLNDSTPIPNNINSIAIVNPTDSFSVGELNILDKFLDRGGNIFFALNRVKSDLQTLYATEHNTQLETWLERKGIKIKPALLADAKCGNVSVQQQNGMFRYMTQISFPYIPIISKFSDNPIVNGLEGVIMPFTSPLEFTGDSSIKYMPLAYSSEKAAVTKVPFMFNVQKQWTAADLNQKGIVVAAAFNGKFAKDTTNKIVVIGNGVFALNEKGNQQKIQSDNVSLFVNSIDWLSDNTGLIELRTKGISSRPIDELEDGTKTLLKYLNFLLPIILIVLYGLFRSQRNKNIRIKRMEANYE